MWTESKTLTAERICKDRALAWMRKSGLSNFNGRCCRRRGSGIGWGRHPLARHDARNPELVCSRFADPRHADAIIRAELEIALKQLKGRP